MTIKAIENWAVIQGVVVDISPHDELSDYVCVTIEVKHVAPVSGYPNLFSWAVGKQIFISVPSAKASELALAPEDQISSRVRNSGPLHAFVDSDSLVKSG